MVARIRNVRQSGEGDRLDVVREAIALFAGISDELARRFEVGAGRSA